MNLSSQDIGIGVALHKKLISGSISNRRALSLCKRRREGSSSPEVSTERSASIRRLNAEALATRLEDR